MRHVAPAFFVGIVSCLVGCGAAPPAPATLRTVELLTGGAREGEVLPLVVALHGRGGTPERFAQVFAGLPVRARVALVEAPYPEGNGRSWFTYGSGITGASEQLRDVLPVVERTVRALLAGHPTSGLPVLTGFSQGAEVVYPLALRHRSEFAGAVPVSGALLPHVLPFRVGPGLAAPLFALHGDRDEVVPLGRDLDAVATLRARGVDVDLEVVHGARHWIGGALRSELYARLARLLPPPSDRRGDE